MQVVKHLLLPLFTPIGLVYMHHLSTVSTIKINPVIMHRQCPKCNKTCGWAYTTAMRPSSVSFRRPSTTREHCYLSILFSKAFTKLHFSFYYNLKLSTVFLRAVSTKVVLLMLPSVSIGHSRSNLTYPMNSSDMISNK